MSATATQPVEVTIAMVRFSLAPTVREGREHAHCLGRRTRVGRTCTFS